VILDSLVVDVATFRQELQVTLQALGNDVEVSPRCRVFFGDSLLERRKLLIDRVKPLIDRVKSPIDLGKPSIDLGKPSIDVTKTLIDVGKVSLHLGLQGSNGHFRLALVRHTSIVKR